MESLKARPHPLETRFNERLNQIYVSIYSRTQVIGETSCHAAIIIKKTLRGCKNWVDSRKRKCMVRQTYGKVVVPRFHQRPHCNTKRRVVVRPSFMQADMLETSLKQKRCWWSRGALPATKRRRQQHRRPKREPRWRRWSCRCW
jgi:hypothetical protein